MSKSAVTLDLFKLPFSKTASLARMLLGNLLQKDTINLNFSNHKSHENIWEKLHETEYGVLPKAWHDFCLFHAQCLLKEQVVTCCKIFEITL